MADGKPSYTKLLRENAKKRGMNLICVDIVRGSRACYHLMATREQCAELEALTLRIFTENHSKKK